MIFALRKSKKTDTKLVEKLERLSSEELYNRLIELDPVAAHEIHPNNVQRVIRAIERVELSGKQKSDIDQNQGNEPLYPHYIIGLTIDREILYERINKRVDMMMEKGLLNEVKGLYEQNIRDVQSIQAIGYKEIYAYLDGKSSLEDALVRLKTKLPKICKTAINLF